MDSTVPMQQTDRLPNVDSHILEAALKMPEHDRRAYLDSVYKDNSQAAQGVLDLLSRIRKMEGFLEHPLLPAYGGTRLHAGDLIENRFEILSLAGEGGMGAVYQVYDQLCKEKVALKLTRDLEEFSGKELQILRDEIVFARRISHPNVCRINELFTARYRNRSIVFLTMEWLEGKPLSEHLASESPPSHNAILSIVSQIAAGLDAVHKANIVHRDLKPGNIFLVPESSELPRVVITDFGLACSRSVLATATQPSEPVRGTPMYMAPEQFLDNPVSPATDVYALALITFELISGRRLYSELPTAVALFRRVADECAPEEALALIPPGWREALAKALRRDPTTRYQTAGEFATALHQESGQDSSPTPGTIIARRAFVSVVIASVVSGLVWKVSRPSQPSPLAHDFGRSSIPRATTEFEAGNRAWAAKNPKEAILRFRNALSIDPAFVGAASRLADVLMADDQPDEAFQQYSRASKLLTEWNANDRESLVLRGRFALDVGLLQEADDLFARYMLEFPSDPMGNFYRASAQMVLGHTAYAESLLTDAVRKSPNSYVIWMCRARLYLETGQLAKAEADLDKARKRKEGDWTDQLAMALAFARDDFLQTQKAIDRLLRTGSLDFQSKSYAFQACLDAERGEWRRAEQALQNGMRFDLSHDISLSALATKRRMLSQIYLSQGQIHLARCSSLDCMEQAVGHESRFQAACILARTGVHDLNPEDLCYTHRLRTKLIDGCLSSPIFGAQPGMADRHCENSTLPPWPVYEYWKRRLRVELALQHKDFDRAVQTYPTIPEPPVRHIFPDYLFRIADATRDRELRDSTLNLLRSQIGRWWLEPERNAPGFFRELTHQVI